MRINIEVHTKLYHVKNKTFIQTIFNPYELTITINKS